MYHDLKKLFWWLGMKKETTEFVYDSFLYQKSKIEHQKLSGMLQPLFMLEWKWDSIYMDFVAALPKTTKGSYSIWVIVHLLTKSTHFIPNTVGMTVAKLVEIYIEHIVRLHGIPSCIVSDRDLRFTLKFWDSLQAP